MLLVPAALICGVVGLLRDSKKLPAAIVTAVAACLVLLFLFIVFGIRLLCSA